MVAIVILARPYGQISWNNHNGHWRHQQNGGAWGDNFNAAFADGETDSENFDQTRNAGPNSMRDDHDDWEDIDELSDASFPASDPPSFNPGTA